MYILPPAAYTNTILLQNEVFTMIKKQLSKAQLYNARVIRTTAKSR